ncbi:MAG: inositol monophosphatase [Chlorobi bacterium]|nr:inositol monophosphatase [Chlorobiota bacterium]
MFTDSDLQSLLDLAVRAAEEAGRMLYERFHDSRSLSIAQKDEGINNLVTEMDTAAEKLISDILSEQSDIVFLGEETGGNYDFSHPTWVVDPIDGTVNYAHGLPIWCVSIALVYEREPLVGVICNPNLKETFTAIQGKGAWLNGTAIHVSNEKNFQRALLVTGFPYDIHENPHGTIDLFEKVLRNGHPVRRLGSAALDLAYIAAGRFEGFWEVSLNPWDVAAGILLVHEAGGKITSYAPAEEVHVSHAKPEIIIDRLLATNGLIHEEMVGLLGF